MMPNSHPISNLRQLLTFSFESLSPFSISNSVKQSPNPRLFARTWLDSLQTLKRVPQLLQTNPLILQVARKEPLPRFTDQGVQLDITRTWQQLS